MAGKSKKAKQAKPVSTADLAAAIGVTVERYRRDDWTREKATVRKGAAVEHPPRRVSRIDRFLKDGWIDKAGQVALERYELMVEAAGYGHARSCLDMSPVGHSDGGMPQATIRARCDLARLRNILNEQPRLSPALDLTTELLFSLDVIADVTARLIDGGRNSRLAKAREMVAAIALALHIAFEVRRAA